MTLQPESYNGVSPSAQGNEPTATTAIPEPELTAGGLAGAEFSGEERAYEVALAHSRDRYRSLVQAIAEIVWTNDAAGWMVGEQPSWAAFTGQSAAQYQHYGWAEAVHPDDRDHTLERWQQAVASRSTFVVQHRVRRYDGVYRFFAVRGVPVLETDGQIREWVGVHTDITQQHEIVEQLQASEAQSRLLAATVPAQVWTAQPDGALDYVSPFTGQYFGCSAAEVVGAGWQAFVHPADLPAALQTWQQCLQSGQPYTVEFRLQRAADRAYRWHTGHAVPLQDNGGHIIKWIGTNTDIDDQRRSTEIKEAALYQMKAERQRLLNIFMQAPMVVAVYQGPEHVITMVNALWEQFTGKHNVLHKKACDVFPELAEQGILGILDQVHQSRQVFEAKQMRVLLARNAGESLEETYWDLLVQPFSDKDERSEDILAYAVEVTEQVRTRQEIERLQSQLNKFED